MMLEKMVDVRTLIRRCAETEYRASELGIRALAETFLLHSQFFTGQSSHHRCKTAAASMSVDPEEKFSRKADKGW